MNSMFFKWLCGILVQEKSVKNIKVKKQISKFREFHNIINILLFMGHILMVIVP